MAKNKTKKKVVRRKTTKSKKKTIKNKKNRMQYSEEAVKRALVEVKQGSKISEVSKKYDIPDSTLRAKKLNKYNDKKPGPAPILNKEQEQEIVDWIFEMCRRGFPVTKAQLLSSVQFIIEKLKIKNPFKDNMPGRKWYKLFMERHPNIASRVTEKLSSRRAAISEKGIRQWFQEIHKYLSENDLLSIGPERVFNCDESGKCIPLLKKDIT